MGNDLSVNRLAWKLVQQLIKDHGFYGVKVDKSDSGATIIDAGIDAKGGFETGRLITEICMGGCGKARITCKDYENLKLPSIFVYSDHPVVATLGSQYAGWQINEQKYFAIGSGPARALALKPKEIYREIAYRDHFEKATVVLETEERPPEKLVEQLAEDCKILPDNLAIILTPTTSLAGATQISGRIVETGIHKLRLLGLDVNIISSAWGCAPIPPSHPKFTMAMARTNDAILYGGVAYYVVECDDEELETIVRKAPSKAAKDHGKSFSKIFREAKYDFYKIDPGLFAPAVVIINNMKTGRIFRAGEINADVLAMSFGS